MWVRTLASSEGISGIDRIAIDLTGNVYFSGGHDGIVYLDPGPGTFYLESNSNLTYSVPILLSKLDALGNLVWATQFKTTDIGAGIFDLELDSNGDIYISGSFLDSIDFDPGIDTLICVSSGATDGFMLKLSQDVCWNFVLELDSISDVTCSNFGYISTSVVNGAAPFSFNWNTTPAINSSTIQPTVSGIYTVEMQDTRGCQRVSSFILNGPSSEALGHYDLNVNLIAGNFRKGLPVGIDVNALNSGCQLTSGNIKVVLDNLIDYLGASPVPDTLIGDTLIWNFTNLNYDSSNIMSHIELFTPLTAEIGDTICLTTIITPITGDIDSLNNIKTYCFPVINGYDPNDKQVYPVGKCSEHYIKKNQLLTYTVRFQNTGNAEAININVLDSLDSNLDLNTVRVIGNSHPVITEVLPGNVLKFEFDNINLPDSGSNEAGSHGYIIFEVLPDSNLAEGTRIENQADIYFDFNPPIITNSVFNTITLGNPDTIVCISPVGIVKQKETSTIRIYPNPNTGKFTIDLGEQKENITIELTNILGQTILTEQKQNARNISMEITGTRGLYFVTITDGKGYKSVVKVIKE